MYTVHMPKKDDMTIVVKPIKGRQRAVPKSQTHKDKRRTPKCHQRAALRKEF